jgi:HAD superfamily hydrolase (TIGR01509 family)
MNIKAAIFDLDGTLMDSEVLWVEATEQYLRDRGHIVGHEEALAIVYGRSWRDVYGDVIARYPELDQTMEEMEESMRVYMLGLREEQNVVIDNSVALLARLAEEMPVCIVSGSPRVDVDAAVELMGVRGDLAFTIAADDYGPGKPDPTCFRMAAERLDLDPSQCVVFEDSEAGIIAAKSAGMYCVALVRHGVPAQDVTAADVVVEDLGDFRLP